MRYAMRFSENYAEKYPIIQIVSYRSLRSHCSAHFPLLRRYNFCFHDFLIYFSSMYPFTLSNVILMRCSLSVPGIIPHSSRWSEKENDFNFDGGDFGLFSDKRHFSGLYVAFTNNNILKFLFPSFKIFVCSQFF